VATEEWQQFYDHWNKDSASSRFSDEFPYVLDLGMDPDNEPLLPWHEFETAENQILITKSYDEIFHYLLLLRQKDVGDTRGAVLTGQPGAGVPL
jgi:hypothetical protein